MSKMTKVIGELSELNNNPRFTNSDFITIDKHERMLYIYSRFNLWRGLIFELDAIAKILLDNGCSFYLSDTKYGHPCVVVSSM